MAQWVKDPTLLLRCGCNPWPAWEIPHVMGVAKKNKKERKEVKMVIYKLLDYFCFMMIFLIFQIPCLKKQLYCIIIFLIF